MSFSDGGRQKTGVGEVAIMHLVQGSFHVLWWCSVRTHQCNSRISENVTRPNFLTILTMLSVIQSSKH